MNRVVLEGHSLIFSSNSASSTGGAIAGTNVQIRLERALFVNNAATLSGGAVSMPMLIFGPAPSIIANSIFTANQAADGSAFEGGQTLFLNDSVVANQGGPAVVGMSVVGPLTKVSFRNTALVGNSPSSCPTDSRAELVADMGNNLRFPAASGCPATIPVADPQFDSMLVPARGGPAFGAGDLAACLADPITGSDVYGRHRPQGKSCTIGAVEGDIEDIVLARNPQFKALPKTLPFPPCKCTPNSAPAPVSHPDLPPR